MIFGPRNVSPVLGRSHNHGAWTARVKRTGAVIAHAGLMACTAASPASTAPRPDILIVITDDQGWGDWEGSGNPDISTPAMMRLAEQGVSFTDFHVSPVCAPTRASLLSGRHSLETGVWGVTRGGERMRPEVETLAEALGDAGYRTGLFGKWHNGDSPPYDAGSQGFDRFFGFASGHLTDYFDPVLEDGRKPVQTRGYVTNVITDAALDWLGASDQPSLTVVAYNTPHSPLEVPDEWLSLYAVSDLPEVTQVIYAMISQTDAQFGRLLDAVDDDAVVIFVGDNGPARPGGVDRYKAGLRGQKGSVYFGGTQVPMLIRWPGVTEAGSRIAVASHGIDVMPTLLKGLGLEINSQIDGVDLAPMFGGEFIADRILFTHHANVLLEPDTVPIEVAPGAARGGNWSAVLDTDGDWSLYNGQAQTEDVKAQHPDILTVLQTAYLDWFQASAPHARDVQPTVLGNDALTLPAHNGTPSDNAVFNGRWGWSHDWVDISGDGALSWPVANGGRYSVTLLHGGAGEITLNGGAPITLPDTPAPLSFAEPGHRRVVFTGEALTRDWAQTPLGELSLGEGEVVLGARGELSIKGLLLEPVP